MIKQTIEWYDIKEDGLPKDKTGILFILVATESGYTREVYYNTKEKKIIKNLSNPESEFNYNVTHWAYYPKHPIENQMMIWVENEVGKENMI